MKNFGVSLVIVGSLLITGTITYFGPEIREHFGTRYRTADRNIFENSGAYVRGSIENLNRLRMEYQMAETENHRNAIRTMVLSQTGGLDTSLLPYDLQQWVNQMKGNPQ